MSFLIDNNTFTLDSYGLRETRLYFLSHSIGKFADELAISGEMLEWALGAYEEFNAARLNQSLEIGEMKTAFQTYQVAANLMTERYQILKNILTSRYCDDVQKLNVFSISDQTPRTQAGIIQACELLTGGNAKLKTAGDTNVLPDTIINNFKSLIDDTKEKYLIAGMERDDALQSTKTIKKLFASDSQKLRAIYNWVVASWGKYELRLLELGFVDATVKKGGKVPTIPLNPVYDSESHKVKWDNIDDVTSYQMAYSEAGKSKSEWQTAYSGIENEAAIETGKTNLKIKVRARSANGYGKWSEELSIGQS